MRFVTESSSFELGVELILTKIHPKGAVADLQLYDELIKFWPSTTLPEDVPSLIVIVKSQKGEITTRIGYVDCEIDLRIIEFRGLSVHRRSDIPGAVAIEIL